jgi:hypothetical protein
MVSNEPTRRFAGRELQFALMVLALAIFLAASAKTRAEMLGGKTIAWKRLAQSTALVVALAAGAAACGGGG